MEGIDIDRIRGAIYGCALGDALGLPAEGGDKAILAERYPKGLSLPHPKPVRGFPLNDWTDDTDNAVLIMRSLAADGESPACDFARRLVDWFGRGFPELGDTAGSGCGNMTWRVLRRADFVTDPFHAAKEIIGPKAGNGALMRTAPCAFTADPAAWAEYFCLTTHSDPRCVASCIAQCTLIRELATLPPDKKVAPAILERAITASGAKLSPAHRKEMMDWAMRSASLAKLEIGGRDARGYTFKTLGCAFWAFRALLRSASRDAAFFKKHMIELVMEAGDADTNAAVAGAVLGAAMGYRALPQDWIAALPNRAWLDAEIDAWVKASQPKKATTIPR